MTATERDRLRAEIDEIECLIAVFKAADDIETCWALYLLTQCLANKRRHLSCATRRCSIKSVQQNPGTSTQRVDVPGARRRGRCTACRPSRWGIAASVPKNCEPLVSGPD